ncbi:CHAP domain-containing protein [Rhodovibrio salinarum]|uniref:CHAP domain-containing protein n=1 Tax=Rhodovibrio salinarum TaxID=1087 RepID=UPI0004B6ACFD|nr:CHAP domain-containing protein [Rhodovibrio salinarum]
MTRTQFVPFAVVLLALAACSTAQPTVDTERSVMARPQIIQRPEITRPDVPKPTARPVMYSPSRPLQCVPYARKASGIQIRGDAWTWWRQASGRYPRGQTPKEGALILLDTGYKRGHLAYVSEVRGTREIVVNHANWLNHGRIHENTPVRDVSRAGDWSQVRLWYVPGNQLGASAYDVIGFIYPDQRTAQR